MLPFSTLIRLVRSASTPLSQQLTTGFIQLIQQGLLPANAPLPGTRTLATQLRVHRQTVVSAFEELAAQGWIVSVPAKGTRVSPRIPVVPAQPLPVPPAQPPISTGFTFTRTLPLALPTQPAAVALRLDTCGSPDPRLAPLAALARKYRTVCRQPTHPTLVGYATPEGNAALRTQLTRYLLETRGVAATPDQLLITRGSTMAMYLVAQLLLAPGDTVVVATRSYPEADLVFQHHGGCLQRVGVDEHGLCVAEVEALCQRQRVRLLYLTPHHHYPTTVTLSAERRVHLLQLAERYDFVVLEDDYDFDYHYEGSPILPLASADRSGRVLYVGSLSKVLAPAFRVGYVVGPANFVAELGKLRRLLDHQGDAVLEQGIAELLAEGELRAHLKRARKIYHRRRDVFCQLLRTQLADWVTFQEPAGGMAVWGRFAPEVDLVQVAAACQQRGLGLGDGRRYQLATERQASHLRLGFAALQEEELVRSVEILRHSLHTIAK